MNKEDIYRIFGITDIIRLPEAVMDVLVGDREERNRIYGELLCSRILRRLTVRIIMYVHARKSQQNRAR